MPKPLWILVVALPVFVGCKAGDPVADIDQARHHVDASDGEVVVPLKQVPADVVRAAEKAVPGIVLTRAEREVEDGVVVYDLEGTAQGTPYEVEVTAQGKVLEIEEDDDENDDDDWDDDE